MITPISPALVRWNGSQCRSASFDDIYFSADGPAEVARVFHTPVRLAQRFAAATDTFTCAELGFGSGLSFAVTAELFCHHNQHAAGPRRRLHYISVDAAPFAAPDRARICETWRAELPIFEEYTQRAPALLSGWHRIWLRGGQICLSLYHGSAQDALRDLQHRQLRGVDHWLLDGFSPRHNPAMWTGDLLQQVASLSAPRGSVATFTAAGQVRRDLARTGYEMQRVDQQPHKRHSLAGHLRTDLGRQYEPPPAVDVVGGGIAGASVARALAQRGRRVRVYEPSGRTRGASRIPAASVHGRLLADGSLTADWQLASFHFSHRALLQRQGYRPSGVIQRVAPNADADRITALLARYAASGDWLYRAAAGDLHYRIGGVVRGALLCRSLLDHPLIELIARRFEVEAQISPPPARIADTLAQPTVLAAGHAVRDYPPLGFLELSSMMGQAELCSIRNPPTQPIVHDGYVAPYRAAPQGGMVIGSTYEYRPWPRAQAAAENLARWPEHGKHRGSFRARRAITSDRLPIVGRIHRGDGGLIENLWLSTGFGSTGMTAAPLAGEIIAAIICGEIPPISAELETLLQGSRFHARQRRRGTRLDAQMDRPAS